MIGQLYQARRIARIRYLLGGLIALAISVGIALFSGDTPISPSTLVKALLSSNDIAAERLLIVFMRIRAPRIMLAVVAGGSLGAAGALMQSVLGNPLASPFTLGVSSAAGFGASLAIVAGHSLLTNKLAIVGNAFVFAMGANLIVYILAASLGASPLLIVLAGMGINFLFSSLTTLLHYFSTPEAVYRALFWTAGSLSVSSWDSVLTLSIVFSISLILVLPILYDLSLVVEGDAWATVVGVDVYKVRLTGLLIASVLAAVTVSFVGVIGFIGLVAPHLCRLTGMEDPRGLIPLSAITGGTLLVLADLTATRLATPIVLPIGAVTSLLGVAFLAAFALSKRRRMWMLA